MKFFYSILIAVAALIGVSSSEANAQVQSAPPVIRLQERVLDDGAAQAIHAVTVAKQICEAAGGTYDPTQVRPQVRSATNSRVESRAQQRYNRYGGGRNVMHLDLNRVFFGQPVIPQDYRNEVDVRVEADNACKPKG